ncbi:hypothetical protein ITP53_31670 [Nonomuraea sp. K274]|uniref:Uncharacterized protein n=1 Tax=Nonomuraea cypriaca TaxID=1187855 RepID=A0A931F3K9_9ACTN|nr:hypothetical protein [Nonomuraea cypriaca]MBF8190206.1 hypothetical protein [Nonomuraea cypriaca]
MDPVVVAAGSALVTAMATDAWQQARTAVVALWRRFHPEQAGPLEAELAEVRAQVLAARLDGDTDTEEALAGAWRLRLAQLLRQSPEAGAELRRLLDERLTPAAAPRTIEMNATAHDESRVYQSGGDMHITGQ